MRKNYDAIIIESESEKEQYRNSYLHLHTIGFAQKSHQMFSHLSPLTDYLFTIILDGNGHYCRDENKNIKNNFAAGDLILFKPGDYFYICPKGDVERLWFHVLGTAIPEILTTIPLDEKKYCMNLSVEKRNNFSELFNELFATAKQTPFHSTKLNALLLNLLASVSKSTNFESSSGNMSMVLEYINNNYRKDIQIQTLAEIAHLNHYYFIKHFKKTFGLTPYQYILRKRFNTASSELINTNMTVDDIATRNGFNNRTHFSQMFKTHYGMSPIEYRKRY